MIAINKSAFRLHKHFGCMIKSMILPLALEGDKMRFEKPKKCLDCLCSKLNDNRVYCYEWGVIVFATHAKICSRFIPRKRRRAGEVIRHGKFS